MKSTSTTSFALWATTLLLAFASLAFGYFQLDGLPDLGVQFGPQLTVRSVSVDRNAGTERQEFKRGDRLMAVAGQSVEDLRDLRSVLQNLPEDSGAEAASEPPVAADEARRAAQAEAGAQAERTASYQLVRPLHRFHITLQGELNDPTGLPQGVEPTDRLIEIDGRELQTKVGPEAVRSIIASRPQSVLFFERQNAVFSGTMHVPEPGVPFGAVGAFGLVIAVLLALWFFRSRDLEPGAVVAVGLQTVCIGWIGLLAFQYQWTISDYGLTAAVIAAFALVRPFSFFARNIGGGYGTQSGWVALIVGVVATLSVFGLLFGGYFETAEQALHVAALIAGLFVVYEVFLASIDDGGPTSTLGEGTGYLAWILVLALFSALFAWYLAPISFEENRWRWFSAVIVGLVWFGDVLYCFRGPGSSGYQAVAQRADREHVIVDYLDRVREQVREVRPFFVVATPHDSVLLEARGNSLRVSPTSDELHDAVSILVQEGARIPLPDAINRQAHPMGGIAATMDIALALRMGAPDGGVQIDQLDLVLVGIEESPTSELPVHPSNETLDELRHLLSGEVWTAALLEGLTNLGPVGEDAPRLAAQPASPTPADGDRRAAELEAELEEMRRELEARDAEPVDEPVDEADVSETDAAETEDEEAPVAEPPMEVLPAAPGAFEELLEPELVEALDYLLESEEPIVIGGKRAAGKSFIARCAHELDGRGGELWVYRTADRDAAEHAAHLFGALQDDSAQDDAASDDSASGGLVERAHGGALVVESCEQLSDTLLLRLCQAAEQGEVRLYLSFDDPDAEARSVLDERPQEVRELLEHRELIVPRLAHRPTIFEPILEYFLREWRERTDNEAPVGFTPAAIAQLRAYDFPGELAEARALVEQVAERADGEEISIEELAGTSVELLD